MFADKQIFLGRCAKAAWRNPYVTDGLVAMWDGEWNAGGGVHDPNATTWLDLVGGRIASGISTSQVGANFMKSDGVHRCYLPTLPPMVSFTIEMVVTDVVKSKNWMSVWAASNDYNSMGWSTYNQNYISWKYYNTRPSVIFTKGTLSALADGTTSGKIVVNGGATSSSSATGAHLSWGTSPLQWSNPWSDSRGTLKNHCIRVYARAISAPELAANYAIDRERFNLP